VIRDFGTAEWFHSLLHALEDQDTMGRIEISIYLTAQIKHDDMTNIMVQDVGAEKDAITALRAPTHFGRPNWDRVFASVADRHPDTDVGVFFCGPPMLSRTCVAFWTWVYRRVLT
jgi:NADPH oxidase 2